MTIKEIKKYIRIHKIRYKTISEKSGIPLGTLRNIFSNAEIDPRISTVQKIEKALEIEEGARLAEKYYTLEEESLIDEFRALSPRDKQIVLKIVKEMADPRL